MVGRFGGSVRENSEDQQDRGRLREAVSRVFGPVDDTAFAEVASAVRWVEAPGGSVVYRQGEPGDSLCLLLRGRLHVRYRDPEEDADRLVAEIAPGEAVGEIGLLTGNPRSATVVAVRDSLLAQIDAPTFDRLAEHHPAMVRKLSKVVVDRLSNRSRMRRFSPRVSNIAVLPAGQECDTGAFMEALSAALAEFGATLPLDAEGVEAQIGLVGAATAAAGSEAHARLTDWLAEQESKQDFVLYRADPEASEWTRRCLRQADLVIVLAEAAGDPKPGRTESELCEGEHPVTTARRVLVFMRPPDEAAPSGTAAWLRRRSVDGHHHVRTGSGEDFARLARVLSGNAVGLVLGGGAARGFAHVGVYRALVEAGVSVDWVGGSSIGSVFAAAIALGWPPDQVEATARSAFVDENPLGDYTLPVVSLLRGKRLERLTQRYFATDIADLPIPFFCISSNLSQARMTVHERGPLSRAIRASVALPGVLPPAVADDHLVIDGGILNNLPVDVMRDRPVGRVIAVDLSVKKEYQLDYSEIPGALRVLRSRLPFAKRIRVPGIVTLMMKATEVASLVHARDVSGHADLVLKPPVGRFGILDTASFDAIVEVGYEHAAERLTEWLDPEGAES
jgi:predicted acylesterase/phospholipase RssA/CRP-like cAMP-binding protein